MARIEEISDSSGEEDDVYVVERIVDFRETKKGDRQYLIKWKGYSEADNTWEDEDNILDKSMIEAFHKGNDKPAAKIAKPTSEKSVKRPIVGDEETPKEKRAKAADNIDKGNDLLEYIADEKLDRQIWKENDWSEFIKTIDTMVKHETLSDVYRVYATWKSGKRYIHESTTLHERCPIKLIKFYEQRLKFSSDLM